MSAAESEPLATAESKSQKIKQTEQVGEGVEAFESKKFTDEELHILGLDDGSPYYRIEFDDEKSIKYGMMASFILSLITVVLWPFWLLFSYFIYYCIKTHAYSRKAALTNTHLIMHGGWYGCGCCCWNEQTKSIPLEKITDLAIKQGCINSCFDIKEITVDTASVTQEANELKLIGVIKPGQLRKKVLSIRDKNSKYHQQIPLQAQNMGNPLLDVGNTEVHQTLIEMKDLLVDMNQNIKNLKADS